LPLITAHRKVAVVELALAVSAAEHRPRRVMPPLLHVKRVPVVSAGPPHLVYVVDTLSHAPLCVVYLSLS